VTCVDPAGFRPIYVTMALIAVSDRGAAAIVFVHSVRCGRARCVGRRRVLDEERLAIHVRASPSGLQILDDPALMRRLAIWATSNWLLDAAALWVFMRAFGVSPRIDSLLVAFCVANISASIPITPGGLGVLDATLVAMLALFGYGNIAGIAVPMYRLAQYWLPIPLGALSYVSLRAGPWRVDRERELRRLREETDEVVQSGETVYEWAERYGSRRAEEPVTSGLTVQDPPPAAPPFDVAP
jgi:uncharacterized membrane protein YbhN (UPF0104 family)